MALLDIATELKTAVNEIRQKVAEIDNKILLKLEEKKAILSAPVSRAEFKTALEKMFTERGEFTQLQIENAVKDNSRLFEFQTIENGLNTSAFNIRFAGGFMDENSLYFYFAPQLAEKACEIIPPECFNENSEPRAERLAKVEAIEKAINKLQAERAELVAELKNAGLE